MTQCPGYQDPILRYPIDWVEIENTITQQVKPSVTAGTCDKVYTVLSHCLLKFIPRGRILGAARNGNEAELLQLVITLMMFAGGRWGFAKGLEHWLDRFVENAGRRGGGWRDDVPYIGTCVCMQWYGTHITIWQLLTPYAPSAPTGTSMRLWLGYTNAPIRTTILLALCRRQCASQIPQTLTRRVFYAEGDTDGSHSLGRGEIWLVSLSSSVLWMGTSYKLYLCPSKVIGLPGKRFPA
ncbi:hypothetical protein BDZ91DRAFT_760485 [Kalaharituber pfeilii]|nr:hypothetical protein BDZ91DRAFT_760485 [Kalaharituber pfeilii]